MCFVTIFYSMEGKESLPTVVKSNDGFYRNCFALTESLGDALVTEINYEGESSFRGPFHDDQCFS